MSVLRYKEGCDRFTKHSYMNVIAVEIIVFIILPLSDCSSLQNGRGQHCQQSKSSRVHPSNQPGERVKLTYCLSLNQCFT